MKHCNVFLQLQPKTEEDDENCLTYGEGMNLLERYYYEVADQRDMTGWEKTKYISRRLGDLCRDPTTFYALPWPYEIKSFTRKDVDGVAEEQAFIGSVPYNRDTEVIIR